MEEVPTPGLKNVLRMWGVTDVPFHRQDCLDRLVELVQDKGDQDWEDLASEAKEWVKNKVAIEMEANRRAEREEDRRKRATFESRLSGLVENNVGRIEKLEDHVVTRFAELAGDLEERFRQIEVRMNELDPHSVGHGPPAAFSGSYVPYTVPEPTAATVTETQMSIVVRPVELPRIASYPTWRRFVSAFRVLGRGVSGPEKERHFLGEASTVCPEILGEVEAGRLINLDQMIAYFCKHPLEIERAKLSLGNIRAGKKDPLEGLFHKIEALVEQAYPEYTLAEQFRETVRAF